MFKNYSYWQYVTPFTMNRYAPLSGYTMCLAFEALILLPHPLPLKQYNRPPNSCSQLVWAATNKEKPCWIDGSSFKISLLKGKWMVAHQGFAPGSLAIALVFQDRRSKMTPTRAHLGASAHQNMGGSCFDSALTRSNCPGLQTLFYPFILATDLLKEFKHSMQY